MDRPYRRLLRLLRPHRFSLAAGGVAAALSAAAAGFYARLLGPVASSVLTGGAASLPGLPFIALNAWALPAWLVGAALLKASSQWIHNGLMQSVGQSTSASLRERLYGHLLSIDPRELERRHSGELLTRLTSDVAQTEFALTQALSSYVKDGLQTVALLVSCWSIDARLFGLAFIVLPAALIPVNRFARSLKRVSRELQSGIGAMAQLVSEQLHLLPVVQAYGLLPNTLRRFDAEQSRYLGRMRRSLFLRGAVSPSVEWLGILGTAATVGYGAWAVRGEPALAEKLLSFLAAALLMYRPAKTLSQTHSLTQHSLASAERLFELLDLPSPPAATANPTRGLSRSLRVEALRVSYGAEREILKGVTLEVPAGSRVALVGPSGGGKTTLFSVLLGFTDWQSGSVLWDGRPLTPADLRAQRAELAWVPQEPVLFSGTVRDNLKLGRPGASEAELAEALQRAHADGFVGAFPHGLDEEVGERGARLSGGQRQRLAIARAFLRKPSLLLLDEPTSALDAASEREVQAGLIELMAGRTSLVIAHRLSTVRDADSIWVLDAGRIVESGTHSELTSQGGTYARLWAG